MKNTKNSCRVLLRLLLWHNENQWENVSYGNFWPKLSAVHRGSSPILYDPRNFERVWERHNAKGSPKTPLVSLNLLSSHRVPHDLQKKYVIRILNVNKTSYKPYIHFSSWNCNAIVFIQDIQKLAMLPSWQELVF